MMLASEKTSRVSIGDILVLLILGVFSMSIIFLGEYFENPVISLLGLLFLIIIIGTAIVKFGTAITDFINSILDLKDRLKRK